MLMRSSALVVLLGAAVIAARPTDLPAQLLNLGAAAGYAGLELNAAPITFTLSKVTARVNGDIGIANNGNFDFSGGGIINGAIYAGQGATVNLSGGSTATGGLIQPYAGITQAIQDAHTAAAFYAGLTPTQTLASIGAGMLTGSGGQNVYQISGDLALSQGQTLTLSGSASDTFIFNISGQVNLSQANIFLSGVSPAAVLFNLIGTGQKVLSTGHSGTQGVFLAENGAIQIDGGVHISDFIAGGTLVWQSGVDITQATSVGVVAVPEAGSVATICITVGTVALLGFLRRKRSRHATGALDLTDSG